jgi:hypothetical protein
MCKFFSVVSDGAGEIMYFDAVVRKQIIAGTLKDSKGNRISETDSHSSIMAFNGIFGKEEDMYNKYEYNPLTREFVKDRISNKDDSELVKAKCVSLDFKTIVPELKIKEIINPKNVHHSDNVNDSEIALLEMWASVWAYISDFFTIANWKYIDHEPCKNPFQPCIDLWNLGLVPSFDGTTWRLHKMCDNAKVIYEWRK